MGYHPIAARGIQKRPKEAQATLKEAKVEVLVILQLIINRMDVSHLQATYQK
jgi:hypothetical protein